MNEPSASEAAHTLFVEHRRHLWAVAYRMLGLADEAEEVVSDCLVRLLRNPPDLTRPIRPWAVRVVVNLATDKLRARRRATYTGPWLPAALDERSPAWGSDVPLAACHPEARYSELETLSMGFLLAAEQLSEVGRAVLVLRDVFGYSVRETANALQISEANVKTTTHRVRARMQSWEHEQRRSLAVPHERVVEVMRTFFAAVAMGNRAAAEAVLSQDVRLLSDGGGEFFAARKPVVGPERIAKFYARLARTEGMPNTIDIRQLGGHPAFFVERTPAGPHSAPSIVLQGELDPAGRITRLYSLLATPKVKAALGR